MLFCVRVQMKYGIAKKMYEDHVLQKSILDLWSYHIYKNNIYKNLKSSFALNEKEFCILTLKQGVDHWKWHAG